MKATKRKLHFLCRWDACRERTWSGTCLSLFRALQAYYELADYRLYTPLFLRILRKIGIVPKNEPSQAEIRWFRWMHGRRFRPADRETCRVFQFTDMLPDREGRETFVYQDLCMNYVRNMSERFPDRFALSNFQMTPSEELNRRARAERAYYDTCKGVFTMGRWMARFLVEELGIDAAKVHHAGGGINLDSRLIGDGSGRTGNKILFVGRDFLRKGGDLVYEAFCLLRQECPEVELYVAGPAADPVEGGQPGYHYMGDCSAEQLSGLFNRCDIFCMPSCFEAYGLVFIEALTYGLPCIGRDRYEMPYFIEDGETGYLIDEDDASLLAGKMRDLLHNERIKARVLERRNWYMEEYSWKKVAERIAEVVG